MHYGGHWAVAFPKPVYWYMAPPESKSTRFGSSWLWDRVHDRECESAARHDAEGARDLRIRLIRERRARKYFPDKIRYTEHFLDNTYCRRGLEANAGGYVISTPG